MAHHSPGGEGGRPEPVAIAAVVQAVLAALVTLGWLQLDDTTIAALGTVVAAFVGATVTLSARRRVTPVADPKAADGTPLVPAQNSVSVDALLRREGR